MQPANQPQRQPDSQPETFVPRWESTQPLADYIADRLESVASALVERPVPELVSEDAPTENGGVPCGHTEILSLARFVRSPLRFMRATLRGDHDDDSARWTVAEFDEITQWLAEALAYWIEDYEGEVSSRDLLRIHSRVCTGLSVAGQRSVLTATPDVATSDSAVLLSSRRVQGEIG